jgi:ureidoglycolate lyase
MNRDVTIEELTPESFAEYGKVIDIPNIPPPKVGNGWDCWNYIAMMDVNVPIGMGLVTTKERDLTVDSMERHVSREELLLPMGHDIIQPVAKCMDLNNPNEQPDSTTVKCFRIRPGQAIVIGKGVWHSPAYPYQQETTYMFAIEKKPDKFGDEMVNPWVKFKDDVTVLMKK